MLFVFPILVITRLYMYADAMFTKYPKVLVSGSGSVPFFFFFHHNPLPQTPLPPPVVNGHVANFL